MLHKSKKRKREKKKVSIKLNSIHQIKYKRRGENKEEEKKKKRLKKLKRTSKIIYEIWFKHKKIKIKIK